jgi:two-component system sensor histidine kinase BaeS
VRNPEIALWIRQFLSNGQRVVVTSPVFKFRADLPAWLALGSVPVIGLAIGVFLSVLLSRCITWPVLRLAEAARKIGRRDLGYHVTAEGSRELLELAQSFNRMADDLERAETARRNLTADIAHELRTLLAVLDGNLRAMLDGIHAPGEDEIALLYEQTRHLNRLAGDLNELSPAEARQLSVDRREVDLARLVKETVAHFELAAQEQGVQLIAAVDEPPTHPALDENPLRQILHNLLANGLRHTPRDGKVTLTAKRAPDGKSLEIAVADSGRDRAGRARPHLRPFFPHRGIDRPRPGRDGPGSGDRQGAGGSAGRHNRRPQRREEAGQHVYNTVSGLTAEEGGSTVCRTRCDRHFHRMEEALKNLFIRVDP